MNTTLLIVDFSAVFWRQWHASANEALTFARQRTVEQIRAHAAEYTRTIVALDSPDCWRRDIWPGYKANRPPKDEAALEQMRQAQADIEALYPSAAIERLEADDVIAWLVRRLPPDWSACILSADKDLVQLLGPRVTMHHLSRNEVITATIAEEATGLPLHRYAHYLALIGDKSDNVLGVSGVGPKRAAELLEKFHSVDGIYGALDEDAEQFTPALRKALLDARTRDDCAIAISHMLVELPPTVSGVDTTHCDPQTIIANWKPPTKANTVTIDEADFDDAIEAPQAPQTPTPAPAPSQPKSLVAPSSDWQRALEPRDTSGAYGLAKVVVNSRMFSGYGTPEAAMLVIMAGREFGLGAMASLRSFHVVEGKPTMSAQAMMARCLEHPSCKLFRVVRSKCTHEVAVVEVQRREWSEPEVYTWTIDDAKRAGLAGRPNWSKYPRDMLINRCVAEAARFTWPEVMAGVYSPDELGGVS